MTISTFLISTHVLSGFLCFALGLLAMISQKGGSLHRMVGKGYLWIMAYLFVSALLILYFVRFNFFLMVIAIFSFYACFSGVRVTKRKVPGSEQWYDWLAAILLLTAGIGLAVFGVLGFWRGEYALTILSAVFGWLAISSSIKDIRVFRETERENRMWWWFSHMSSMLGSYIALITASMVNNMPKLLPDFQFQWIFWILPTIVVVPIMVIWMRSYRLKFEGVR